MLPDFLPCNKQPITDFLADVKDTPPCNLSAGRAELRMH